ncbi:hypothetical protein NFI96_034704, partial [Prochilodus magdalenae]
LIWQLYPDLYPEEFWEEHLCENAVHRSAFNTIIPAKLIPKLTDLGLNSHLCHWVLDFLIGRPQVVRVGKSFSSMLTLSTGAPQGCVLSPLLYSLFTHDCVARHTSNTIFKFADDPTILGLITDGDETAYRDEVSALSYRSARQRLFFLRRLRKFELPPDILTNFYRCTIESILTACITVWYGSCTAYDRKALRRVVRTAKSIIGSKLPDLQDIYRSRCLRKIQKIRSDCSHPAHGLFTLLPSGRRYRSIQARTNRVMNSNE